MPAYDPIIVGVPTDRLILQSGSEITRNEFGLDTRARVLKGLRAYWQALAAAEVGAVDPSYGGLKCIGYKGVEGAILVEVTLNYKGLVSGDARVGLPFNDVTLQSTSVLDTGGNSVDCQYYAPQTTWKWMEATRPDEPTYTGVQSSAFVISPFNTRPHTLITDLSYDLAIMTTHFHTEPAGDFWECEATSAVILIPLAP